MKISLLVKLKSFMCSGQVWTCTIYPPAYYLHSSHVYKLCSTQVCVYKELSVYDVRIVSVVLTYLVLSHHY